MMFKVTLNNILWVVAFIFIGLSIYLDLEGYNWQIVLLLMGNGILLESFLILNRKDSSNITYANTEHK